MQTITAEQFKAKYGEAGVSAFSQLPKRTQPAEIGYVKNLTDAVGSDLATRVQKFNEIQNAPDRNILEKGVQMFGQGAGLAATTLEQTIFQAPGVKQVAQGIGEGINWLATSELSPIKHLGDVIGSSKTLQATVRLYDTNPRFKDTVDALANTVRLGGDVSTIVNSANFATNVTNKVIQEAKQTATEVISGVKTKALTMAEDTPASIMNRVARLKPTDTTKFEQLSGGKTPGDYLVETGNFGAPDKIIQNEAVKFAASKASVDAELAKLPGVYKTGALEDALSGIIEKAKTISSSNVKAPYLARAQELLTKYNEGGLTMSEVNEVKRLFERNVKLGYKGVGAQINADAVQQATNIDSALREWQVGQAQRLGFINITELNKQTQLAKFIIDNLGEQIIGKAGLDGISLTDWIILSTGSPEGVAGFVLKKFLSSKGVQAKIAELLNSKEIKGLITPETSITSENISRQSNPQNLPILPKGASESPTTFGDKVIQVAPQGRNIEITAKQGIIPSKPTTPRIQGKTSLPSFKSTTVPPELQSLAAEARKYKSAEEFVKAIKQKPYSQIGEQYQQVMKGGDQYEFHLSTEKGLTSGKTFAEQSRTTSRSGQSGQSGAEIFSSKNPDFWIGEIAQKGTKQPNQLYLVKVKNATPTGLLETGGESQSANLPKDVTVITKIPSLKNGIPDFGLAQQLREKQILTDFYNKVMGKKK